MGNPLGSWSRPSFHALLGHHDDDDDDDDGDDGEDGDDDDDDDNNDNNYSSSGLYIHHYLQYIIYKLCFITNIYNFTIHFIFISYDKV